MGTDLARKGRELWSVPDCLVLQLATRWKESGNIHRVLDLGCGVGRHLFDAVVAFNSIYHGRGRWTMWSWCGESCALEGNFRDAALAREPVLPDGCARPGSRRHRGKALLQPHIFRAAAKNTDREPPWPSASDFSAGLNKRGRSSFSQRSEGWDSAKLDLLPHASKFRCIGSTPMDSAFMERSSSSLWRGRVENHRRTPCSRRAAL